MITRSKSWFVTGASRGFGREWVAAALNRGDRVAATVRDASSIDDLAKQFDDRLLVLPLDVTDRAAVDDAVRQAHEQFSRLDVVVNNAGYGQFGMVEEVREQDVREQLETNFLGALWVTQAALPFLRDDAGGHIVQVSSVSGVCTFPSLGIYNASKWALEGLSQTLSQEVARFGIHVTIIEPGPYSTDWGGSSARHADPLDAYKPAHEEMRAYRASAGVSKGDPASSAEAVLRVVDAEPPPLRVFFGSGNLQIIEAEYESRLTTWRAWQHIAELAEG